MLSDIKSHKAPGLDQLTVKMMMTPWGQNFNPSYIQCNVLHQTLLKQIKTGKNDNLTKASKK